MRKRDFLAELCWRLGRMVIGKAASGSVPCHPAGAAVLPVWIWRRAKANMGRKGRDLVPVRVDYGTAGPLVLVPEGGTVVVPWTALGAGWELSGHVLVRAGEQCRHVPERPPAGRIPTCVPTEIEAPVLDAGALAGYLAGLAKDGDMARWELLEDFGAMVRKYIWRARSSVLHAVAKGELAERESMNLTEADVDAMADGLVFGQGNGKLSRAERLLGRCLLPGTFAGVDPLRYVSAGLKVAARQAVRGYIGDVPAGPEVRRLADELGLPRDRPLAEEELALVIKAYLARHPNVVFGREQACKALGLRTWATAQSGNVVRLRREPQPSAPDIAEHVTGALSATQAIALIVEQCRAEGGAFLAEVAQVWLASAADDGSLAAEWVSSQVHHYPRNMSQLIAQVRRIAAQVMTGQRAA